MLNPKLHMQNATYPGSKPPWALQALCKLLPQLGPAISSLRTALQLCQCLTEAAAVYLVFIVLYCSWLQAQQQPAHLQMAAAVPEPTLLLNVS